VNHHAVCTNKACGRKVDACDVDDAPFFDGGSCPDCGALLKEAPTQANQWRAFIQFLGCQLKPAEAAILLGRKSATRALADDRELSQYLLAPPPIAEDVTLRNAAEGAAGQARRFAARLARSLKGKPNAAQQR